MNYPTKDPAILAWVIGWTLNRGRKPTPMDLPHKIGAALGKKVFEYAEWRDANRPDWEDELAYNCCLLDHGVAERVLCDGDIWDIARSQIEGTDPYAGNPEEFERWFYDKSYYWNTEI